MNGNVQELETARQQAALDLERLGGELAALTQRRSDVAALVEQRREEQREAARAAEAGDGKDSKPLTRAVVVLQEAMARLDALGELAAAKQADVEAAQVRLTAATRAENTARHEAAVAAARAEAEALVAEVQAGFSALALTSGRFALAHLRLARLDQEAAAEVGARCAPDRLVAPLLAAGGRPLVLAGHHGDLVIAVPVVAAGDARFATLPPTLTVEQAVDALAAPESERAA